MELVGLRGQPDAAIWEYAGRQGFCIVPKDNDFRQLSSLKGPPPKVTRLSVGNAATAAIADLLQRNVARIEAFEGSAEEGLLVLEWLEGDRL